MITPSLRRTIPCIAAMLLLAGCADPGARENATVIKDKQAYVEQNFTLDNVPSDQRAVLAKLDKVHIPFKTLKMTVTVTNHKVNATDAATSDVKLSNSTTYTNLGDGYLRVVDEQTSNDIPNYLFLNLTFDGFVGLLSQNIQYSAQSNNGIFKWDSISTEDKGLSNPKENSTYTVTEVSRGISYGLACTTHGYRAGSTLMPNLDGRLLDMDCQVLKNNVPYEKNKTVYIEKFGMYFLLERNTSTSVITFKPMDFTLTN